MITLLSAYAATMAVRAVLSLMQLQCPLSETSYAATLARANSGDVMVFTEVLQVRIELVHPLAVRLAGCLGYALPLALCHLLVIALLSSSSPVRSIWVTLQDVPLSRLLQAQARTFAQVHTAEEAR